MTDIALATPQELAEAAHKAAEGGGGLPQFDPTPFAGELFWLAVVFAVLYVVYSRLSLPKIGAAVENRSRAIAADRDTAETLARESEDMMQSYEKSLAQARSESGRLHAEAEAILKAETEESMKAFKVKTEGRIKAMESRLADSKSAVMDDMHTIAAEIASSAAEKIVGITTDLNAAKTVVQSVDDKLSKAA